MIYDRVLRFRSLFGISFFFDGGVDGFRIDAVYWALGFWL